VIEHLFEVDNRLVTAYGNALTLEQHPLLGTPLAVPADLSVRPDDAVAGCGDELGIFIKRITNRPYRTRPA